VIYAIAPSRKIDHDIWAGTDDGQIWRTHDEGAHWTNVTPAALTSWSKVGIIDASHFDGETAYAAIDRHRLDDFHPYIYRTHDGGKSWQLIVNGIADFAAANVVREDPVRRGMLYAGTERGIYVSRDDGDHWSPLQLNLPITSVRDIDIHGDDVVIATHGRAFWVLDNVTALRQDLPPGDFLFKPAITVRERPAGFTGSPMPKDEPMAPNPPFGAYIDYAIRTTYPQPVTIEILDASDSLVRRYSSADVPPAMDLKRLGTAPEWFNTPSAVSAVPGTHRFVWPLRYPAPAGLSGRRGGGGSGAYADGVWAPPGYYKVVLTVYDQKFTQPLTVVPDPRVSLRRAVRLRPRGRADARHARSRAQRSRRAREAQRHSRCVAQESGRGIRRDRRRRFHRPAARRIITALPQSTTGEARRRRRQRRRRPNRRRPRKLGKTETRRRCRARRMGGREGGGAGSAEVET
jgi:hypothetical protein